MSIPPLELLLELLPMSVPPLELLLLLMTQSTVAYISGVPSQVSPPQIKQLATLIAI